MFSGSFCIPVQSGNAAVMNMLGGGAEKFPRGHGAVRFGIRGGVGGGKTCHNNDIVLLAPTGALYVIMPYYR